MKKKKIEIFSQKTEWIFGVNYSFKKLNIFSEIKFWELRAVGSLVYQKKVTYNFKILFYWRETHAKDNIVWHYIWDPN